MRIEQPQRLKYLFRESVRQNMRLGRPLVLILGAAMSVCSLGMLALRVYAGERVAAWQWLGAASQGPVAIALVELTFWIHTSGNRYAEIRGHHIRLGPIGYTFRATLLLYCKIESDNNFPEIKHLCFSFRIFRFTRPRFWTMMINDSEEAEAFRREVNRVAAQ